MTTPLNSKVEDHMSRDLVTVSRDATVLQAITLLKEHQVNALVVDRRDEDDEVGLITVADIAREVLGKHRKAQRVYVFEIMTKPTLTIPARMQARYATRLLAQFDLSQAVVIDASGSAIGLIQRRDLIFACLED